MEKWAGNNKEPKINMTISNDFGTIENEFRNKFVYDDLLADLLTFIYMRFLNSDPKYAQEGFIVKSKNSRFVEYYEIKPM